MKKLLEKKAKLMKLWELCYEMGFLNMLPEIEEKQDKVQKKIDEMNKMYN